MQLEPAPADAAGDRRQAPRRGHSCGGEIVDVSGRLAPLNLLGETRLATLGEPAETASRDAPREAETTPTVHGLCRYHRKISSCARSGFFEQVPCLCRATW